VPLPRWVGARWNTRGKRGSCYLAPGGARSRGYKRSRGRESEPVRLLVPLFDGKWWGSRVGDGLHRYLRYDANAQQVLRESAGIISPLGVGTLWANDIRRCLRCEDNARHVPRWGAGVVDSLDSRRGVASCLAMVAPSPPPAARRVAGQTRMLLFCHGGKASSSSPPPGELTTVVVVVALRGEEYNVVAAIEGHELETPEAEHRPGLKRLLKTTHLELNGKLFVNTQQAPTWRANCRRCGPGGPSTGPTSEFCRCVPLPRWVGARWNTRGKRGSCYLAPGGARSRGYKRSRGRGSEPIRLLVPSARRLLASVGG
jgi:hypothetical protein